MSIPPTGNFGAQVPASLGGKKDFVVSAAHSAIWFHGRPVPEACY